MTAPYTDRTDEINAKVKARAAELKRIDPKRTDFDCHQQACQEIIEKLKKADWRDIYANEREEVGRDGDEPMWR